MKKFSSLFLACVFVLALGAGSVLAKEIKITSSNPVLKDIDHYGTDIHNAAYLPGGSTFTVTFTASDFDGEVTWGLATATDYTEGYTEADDDNT